MDTPLMMEAREALNEYERKEAVPAALRAGV